LGPERQRCLLEAVRIATDEDDVGPLSPCAASCLEADTCAAANHDDGLADQFGFALGGTSNACGGHEFLRCVVLASLFSRTHERRTLPAELQRADERGVD
jgi:hypothetical protein